MSAFLVLSYDIDKGNSPKLKASPAGGQMIIRIVNVHTTVYGPRGVPKGLTDVQNLGQGSTPCL